MKDSTMKKMVQLAAKKTGPISEIANASVQQGIVLVTSLEEKFSKTEYKVEYKDEKNGAWCRVYLKDELKAQGFSGAGREDAMLHAVWGAVREEEATHSVNKKLEGRNIKVDGPLRQKLETVHITEGPHRVDYHLDSFKK